MAPGLAPLPGRTAAGRALRGMGIALGSLLILLGLMALPACGLGFAGAWALILAGSAPLTLALGWRRLGGHPRLRRMMAGLLGLGGILALALSGWMLRSGWFCPPDEGRYTVVVLGAKVEGDAPSRMLRRRLETARDYLLAHPEAPVIVAGGQGSDERRSEASVMAAWLLEQGIESSRIYREDRSTNTAQNIAYAKVLLEAESLPARMLIVSDGFHLPRARLLASQLAIESAALPAATPIWLLPAYWAREMLAIVYTLLFGSNA